MQNSKSFGLSAAVCALLMGMSPALAGVSSVTAGFDGLDLTRAISLGQGFIPPDTIGAIGTTQYASILNGGYGVWDRAGNELLVQSTQTFWQNAGATNFGGNFTNGDPRILFNKSANRWVATAFGGDVSFLNIAVSDTDDATGTWRATTFLGFNGAAGGGVADYPTLAMDRNALYIGTNDFDPGFTGSTLHVIPLTDVFGAAAPVVSNRAIFTTRPPGFSPDLGYAQQAANSDSASTTGWVVADGILSNGVGFKVTNAALGSGGAAVADRVDLAGQGDVLPNGDARQPDGSRTLDALDTRISGGAYEHNGKIYFTRTITTAAQDYTVIRVTVLNASDFSIAQQFDIDDGDYDHYQGSIAVNANGAVVNYNRSGFDPATGNITVLANAYTLDANGLLVFDANHVLKVSANPGYSLGSPRNRWGDYSQVNIDPLDPNRFWLIGEYANFRDLAGNDGWATWIAEITFASDPPPPVSTPGTLALMIGGLGFATLVARRRRTHAA